MYRKSTPEEIQAIQEIKRAFKAIKDLHKEEKYTEEDSIEYKKELHEREGEYWSSQF